MTLTKSAIYLIGRLHPEIFELLGNPYGPYASSGRLASVALNPQPLPPQALHTGFGAAGELVRAAVMGERTGNRVAFDIDDWCGTPPKRPPFTWPPLPWPPIHGGLDEQGWAEYHLGLAIGLELSAGAWADASAAEALEGIHEAALGLAGKSAGARLR